MSKKVFVSNLSYQVEESTLEQIFSEVGQVTSVQIPKDRETGRSRGFAFVEFDSEDAAGEAIDRLNGQEVEGRELRLDFARDKREGGGGGFRGGRGGGGGDRGGDRGGFRGGRGGGGGDRGGDRGGNRRY